MIDELRKRIEKNKSRVMSFRMCRELASDDPRNYAMIYDSKTFAFKLLRRVPKGHVLTHRSKSWDPATGQEID